MVDHKKKTRKLVRDDIDNEILKDLYVNKKMSVYRIAKNTGWTDMTIRHRLKTLGVYEGELRYRKETS